MLAVGTRAARVLPQQPPLIIFLWIPITNRNRAVSEDAGENCPLMSIQETIRERVRSAINKVFEIDLADIPVRCPLALNLGSRVSRSLRAGNTKTATGRNKTRENLQPGWLMSCVVQRESYEPR
jgi:hypothetical protein